ncbi:MAG: hypothetical protein M1435_03620 [Actinobacteria bacterium]|nr:hypothetical protein [Actinomycetota bacterium]
MDFDGHFEHLLDPKGRVVMPARLRSGFATRKAYVTAYPGECLAVWAPDSYEHVYLAFARRIQRTRPDMSLALTSHSEEVELDAQWRLSVPPVLIDYAKLELNKPLIVAGNLNHIELLSFEKWAERTDRPLQELKQATSELFSMLFCDGGSGEDLSSPVLSTPEPVGKDALAGAPAPSGVP